MKDGHNFDEKLVTKVKNKIRENLSPRHVPALVLEISEIPVYSHHIMTHYYFIT